MKIWEAKLRLTLDDDFEWVLKFSFKPLKGDYEDYHDVYKEKNNKYLDSYIPKQSSVHHHFSEYTIKQAFEYELSNEEQHIIEERMRIQLMQVLSKQKAEYIKEQNRKMQVVSNFELKEL